ncbi:MAG: DUF882 domain-containing protein [Methylococcaceae bacterium]|nr:MAG: DUF882 domain-containing protein [Methylococcaceae bacterium]
MARQPLHSHTNDDALPGLPGEQQARFTRRRFLGTLAAGIAGTLLLPADEVFAKAFAQRRQISLHHMHTDEKFQIVCCPSRYYDKAVLHRFSEFLRDPRTEQIHRIDAGLLDILVAVAALTHSQGTFQVLSGYRSPETNAMLHHTSSGVAEHSQHTMGKAIDVRLSDVSTKMLHRAGLALKRGGVGYYKQSDFVHLDTGKFRTW